MGRIFNLIVRVLLVLGLQDTQCGFKLFKGEAARALFACQTITGWMFDVEALYLALK
jgi:dolichyl-phosphate beta-glucosyltransferase